MNETWKPVIGYKGFYDVSTSGRVRSINREYTNSRGQLRKVVGRILRHRTNKYGYDYVVLVGIGDKRYTAMVHRLVAKSFIKLKKNRDHINHINGRKLDNRSINLEWVNNAENMRHAQLNNLMKKGEDHIHSKITNKTAAKIKKMLKDNGPAKIARLLDVSKHIVQDISRNRTWRHI